MKKIKIKINLNPHKLKLFTNSQVCFTCQAGEEQTGDWTDHDASEPPVTLAISNAGPNARQVFIKTPEKKPCPSTTLSVNQCQQQAAGSPNILGKGV